MADPTAQVKRKQSGGSRGKEFSEGYVTKIVSLR